MGYLRLVEQHDEAAEVEEISELHTNIFFDNVQNETFETRKHEISD